MDAQSSPPASTRRWYYDVRYAARLAFYAGLGAAFTLLLPMINTSPLERARSTILCVIAGLAVGFAINFCEKHLGRDCTGETPPDSDPTQS
jgi:hypothetical protein